MSYRVFDLTPLTRGAAAERRAVLSGIEFKVPNLVVGGLSALVGVVVMLMLWPWLQSTSLVSVFVFVPLGLWLFRGRSRSCMKESNWRYLQRQAVNNNGRFFIAGEQYEPLATQISYIVPGTVAAPTVDDTGSIDDQLISASVRPGSQPKRRRRNNPLDAVHQQWDQTFPDRPTVPAEPRKDPSW